MSRIRVLMVVGARPQFIKSAPLIHELLSHRSRFSLTVVHSGQHYDPEMSNIFFSELKLPKPTFNLNVRSGTHAYQTATIMSRLEGFMEESKPDVVIAPGDTNTTLAAAITAAKLGLRVAHLEAGLRSGDMSMPEEINRRLTDHSSRLLFAPSRTAFRNLAKEGLSRKAWFTGDTMVDAMRGVMATAERIERNLLESMKLLPHNFVLVTLHRPSNVDDPARLSKIMRSLQTVEKRFNVVFPTHPRTRKKLQTLRLNVKRDSRGTHLISPQGYIETLALIKNAKCLLTDSGGMQKEAFLLRTPCITLRSTTEWPETLVGQANRLILDPCDIPLAVGQAASTDLRSRLSSNPYGNGRTAQKIEKILERNIAFRN